MARRRPCVVGWEDQIRRVLADARQPLTTAEVGQLARVIPTGKHADPDLSQRPGGDVGQDCYRILRRLQSEGLVRRADRPNEVVARWRATPALRGEGKRMVAKLDELYLRPAYEPEEG